VAPSPAPSPAADAEPLLAARRAALRDRRAQAEERWRRYREAAARQAGPRDRSGLEQRLDRLLARGKWPGRVLQIARSGLWRPGLSQALGYGGGRATTLARYVRAGADPKALPRALFDQAWYLQANPELASTAWPPLAHYLVLGDAKGRAPHPLFDVRGYRARHAVKIAASRLTALRHFEADGAREGFDPHPLFDLRHYVGQCEAVAESGENPLVHYLRRGWREGLDPHPLFANDWYLKINADRVDPNSAPLLHYVLHGAAEGRDPHPLFDAASYVAARRDPPGPGFNPLIHFLSAGAAERRNPSRHFDTAYYLEQHPELAESGINPLVHYLTEGAFDGSWPAADFDEASYLAQHPELAQTRQTGLEHWLETHGERPPQAASADGRWVSAEALFEQLRANGRPGEPAVYNLQAYETLSAELARIEAERRDAPARPLAATGRTAVKAIMLQPGGSAEANAAARASDADPLVFASATAQAPSGWLAPLAARLAAQPDVAVLAPRLVTPEGRLWAAGASIAISGAPRRNGAREPADAAAWSAAREVDCAADIIVIRRSAFLGAGGFDEGFTTPQGIVADLCLRLRGAGLRTLYAPDATAAADWPASPADPRDAQRLLERHGPRIEADDAIRVIAFLRPDLAGAAAWGGVARALPEYRGHHQPRLPGELGFYDPDDPAVWARQATLARRYGVHGFCHPFRIEAAPTALLTAAAPDMPFCLRVADALTEPEALCAALAPYLNAPGQIRVAGRPLMLIAAPPSKGAAGRVLALRAAARAQSLGVLHLVRVQDFGLPSGGGALAQGFDAEACLPEAAASPPIPAPGPAFNRRHGGEVRDYRDLARRACAAVDATRIPVVATGSDDTPCGQDAARIFHHASPGAFQAWLEAAMAHARRTRYGDARLVFVHAWNGWSHGACLEPDVRFGHGWLEAVRNAAEAGLLERP
jgi:hypothetical protein